MWSTILFVVTSFPPLEGLLEGGDFGDSVGLDCFGGAFLSINQPPPTSFAFNLSFKVIFFFSFSTGGGGGGTAN